MNESVAVPVKHAVIEILSQVTKLLACNLLNFMAGVVMNVIKIPLFLQWESKSLVVLA